MEKFKSQEITGVIPALITPFDEDGKIDEEAAKLLVDHLVNKGVNGLYLTGSTGEGFLMTPDERKHFIEIVSEQNAGRVPLIAHVGAIGTKISIDLAQQAESAGADAISSVPPFYWKFDNNSIFNYYKDITESTNLPMIVYNIPLAGTIGFDQIIQFASIEGVRGIKYTSTTLFEVPRMKDELGEDFLVYSGSDEMAMAGISYGADGIIGSFYNLMPEVFIKIYKAVKSGDIREAEELQHKANLLILYATKYNYIGIMKLALGWMGLKSSRCRRPFHNFTKLEEEEIKNNFRILRDKYKISEVDFIDAL